ncbi:hypothetical protein B0T17DRAFT_502110 [Bombardia bombarda]|uniref:Uncharacterized protein n=1 Tax=Bombardia bombarda TaxID=252184 RepID=A0AA39XJJ9_9PEZI|nr:hypothetical protein B0T17DRAFT_502110 [Bombardia bombarda]
MDFIRAGASRIVALDREYQGAGGWPPILSFKEPVPLHMIFQACSYTSSATKSYWGEHTSERLTDIAHERVINEVRNRGDSPVSSLKMVSFLRDGRRALLVDRGLFLDTFKTFSLDEYALYLYHTDTPGFHVLDCNTPSSPGTTPTLRFYLNCVDYSIIWSYNPETNTTNAIHIAEYDHKAGNVIRIFLYNNQSSILFNPLFPVFTACLNGFLTNWEDYESQELIPEMEISEHDHSLLETTTMELDPRSSELLQHLSKRCVKAGSIINHAEDTLRILRLSRGIVCKLENTNTLWDLVLSHARGAEQESRIQQSTQEIQEAAVFLKHQLESRITQFENVKGKAREHLSLAMQRIQSTDATINKLDSSSMKVIAIMTMAFLPATFFATVFALPSLQSVSLGNNDDGKNNNASSNGDGSELLTSSHSSTTAPTSALQSGFLVYLAFALPATAMVFFIWGIATGKIKFGEIRLRIIGWFTGLWSCVFSRREEKGVADIPLAQIHVGV